MYVLLSGKPPFIGHNKVSLFKKIKWGAYDFNSKEWSGISKEAKNLIEKLLVKDVDKRLTLEAALNHPWITNNMESYKIEMDIVNRLSEFKFENDFKKYAVETLIETMKEKDIQKLKK